MERIDVEIPAPLSECFSHCETYCVSGCCGLDAFDTAAELIEQWVGLVGAPSVHAAGAQLEAIMAVVADDSKECSITFLNHCVHDPISRQMLLEFLSQFHRSLAAAR